MDGPGWVLWGRGFLVVWNMGLLMADEGVREKLADDLW